MKLQFILCDEAGNSICSPFFIDWFYPEMPRRKEVICIGGEESELIPKEYYKSAFKVTDISWGREEYSGFGKGKITMPTLFLNHIPIVKNK